MREKKRTCSRSGCMNELRDPDSQRYCRECHNAAMREHRRLHPYSMLSADEKVKSNARAYANVYQKRGKLVLQPCEVCSNPNAQKHHPDYSRPLYVKWLCRQCHDVEHTELLRIFGKRSQGALNV